MTAGRGASHYVETFASGLGYAPLRAEGEPAGFPGNIMKPRPWAVRATAYPRRKVARAFLAVAAFICRDTDEGW